MILDRVFLDHPHRVNESFFEHMFFALTFSGRLFKASACSKSHPDSIWISSAQMR